MDFKERLLGELTDLIVKIEKLKTYIYDTENDTELEEKQLTAMVQYRLTLEKRILKLMK